MRRFKKGDKVRVVEGAGSYLQKDTVHVVSSVVGNFIELDRDIEGKWHVQRFELVAPTYPNPPHKHAELIKAWADGAEIQFCDPYDKAWSSITNPTWSTNHNYRIKPSNPNAEKIAEIETTISQLQQQVKELKNAD